MPGTLDQFFASQDWARVEASCGWHVERDPDDSERVFFTVAANDDDKYTALCLCDAYPTSAPSVAFVNRNGEKSDPSAWPHGNVEFHREVKPPPHCFLCMPLTREGLLQHPDWRPHGWNAERHTLLDIFNRITRLLNGPNYLRRGGAP